MACIGVPLPHCMRVLPRAPPVALGSEVDTCVRIRYARGAFFSHKESWPMSARYLLMRGLGLSKSPSAGI